MTQMNETDAYDAQRDALLQRPKFVAGDWKPSQLQLVGGKVLIERERVGERARADGVIIAPEMSRGAAMEANRYNVGTLIGMGPGMKVGKSKRWKGATSGPNGYRWPMPDVPLGARVVYRTWAVRAEVTIDKKQYDLVSDEVVDVVLEGKQGTTVMAQFRPLFDRVLVKRLDPVSMTKGGIIIPDVAKEKQIEGEVLAVGRGRIEPDGSIRPLDMKPGDRVLFGKFAGTDIQVDGVECLILREDDIVGIVVEPATSAAE